MPAVILTAPTPHVIPVSRPYRLDRTLSCGQAFRWRWTGEATTGIFAGRRVSLLQEGAGIRVEGLYKPDEVQALRRYLGVDEPLESIEEALRRDRVLRRILPRTTGIALMRQDPWECLVSFVVSAFNNIPKIELTLDRLSRRFGKSPGLDTLIFPAPPSLASASLRELRACALGYRAAYVREVARLVADGNLDLAALHGLPYQEARRRLLAVPGVGEKVADCVLLFAYGKGEAFPVDVWVKRAVERWYFSGRPQTGRRIRSFALDRFGPLAGYAQQHLFYYMRKRGSAGTRERERRITQ